jgi:hypothetical protein
MKHCPLCGEPSSAKKGGLCSACVSWWYRVQLFTAAQLAEYHDGFRLRLRRMEGRRPEVRKVAVFGRRGGRRSAA